MAVAQWGLGCYERFLDGDGEAWLAAALKAGDFLVETQEREGPVRGGWYEPNDYPHTFDIRGPWLSAMAQGQCASLLARLYRESGRAGFAEAARAGLRPGAVPTAELAGQPFPEEYPTEPPSFVLNGAVFALWGLHDASRMLGDDAAGTAFGVGVDTLARNIHRWDTGYWSRYDLYPHPVKNVASPWYHTLHVNQLRALNALAPRPELDHARIRFEEYARSPVKRSRALVRKVAFRLLVPKNPDVARKLPWTRQPWSSPTTRSRRRSASE